MDPNALLSSCPAERYEILSLLHGGGKSCVYKAKDRTTEKVVAIKFLFPDLSHGEEALKRFRTRAKAAASLSHPSLSPILDFGVSADGKPFVVTEFVEGRSLIDILNRSGRIKQARAVKIFVQLAKLMSYLHEEGFVHGDIKPSYVLIADAGDGDTLRFIDLGLPRSLVPALQAGAYDHFLYVSPEQCKGQDLDPRSDIYSLGCLMYETLTGLPPFISRNPSEILQMHISDEPKSMREARSDLSLPFELDLLVLKALRKNISQRHQSMSEVSDDLEHVRSIVGTNPIDEQIVSHTNISSVPHSAQWSSSGGEFPLTVKVKMAIPVILGVLILGFSAMFGFIFSGQMAHMKTQDERRWDDFELAGQRALESQNWSDAENNYVQAVKVAEKFGPANRRLLVSLRKLQDVYMTEGKCAEADQIEQRLKVLLNDQDSPAPVDTVGGTTSTAEQ